MGRKAMLLVAGLVGVLSLPVATAPPELLFIEQMMWSRYATGAKGRLRTQSSGMESGV